MFGCATRYLGACRLRRIHTESGQSVQIGIRVAAAIEFCLMVVAVVGWQGFRTPEEVQRFGDMMDEMCYIVATKHGGSLKVHSFRLIYRVYVCVSSTRRH